jgi:hypothetical protein
VSAAGRRCVAVGPRPSRRRLVFIPEPTRPRAVNAINDPMARNTYAVTMAPGAPGAGGASRTSLRGTGPNSPLPAALSPSHG